MEKPEQIQSFIDGAVLTFNKPLGWTSFDVVNKVRSMMRYVLGIKKLKTGHAGTLDPLASGLLIICTGKQTKSIESFQEMEKEYTGTIFLGKTTPSFDLETQVDEHYPTGHITHELVLQAAANLSGHQEQIPPLFSAKKIEGERAYEFARRGEHTELKSRKVVISEFEITRYELPEVDFRVVCSKGTYIRSLARDFGKELHSGAHLKSLRRTRIGNFKADGAWTIQTFEQHLRELAST
ncbi:MAG: tRNA pseudouridine(55) synthase TruB [Bacteroides sp.]|jgi:tRNA pseudouridine55 synthase|nr:tRNA pseudouridine(55) synthase TruB [Bacteroides sp.]